MVDKVKKEIGDEADAVRQLLKPCGLQIPEVSFNTVEALLMEDHPYLR